MLQGVGRVGWVADTQPPDVNPNHPRLWHAREAGLNVGDVVPPGRFAQITISLGAAGTVGPTGSPHFHRENLLELFRITRTYAPISRLSCAFAYESKSVAIDTATNRQNACYEVEPIDPRELMTRHDMLWLTWMGEAGKGFESVIEFMGCYWN